MCAVRPGRGPEGLTERGISGFTTRGAEGPAMREMLGKPPFTVADLPVTGESNVAVVTDTKRNLLGYAIGPLREKILSAVKEDLLPDVIEKCKGEITWYDGTRLAETGELIKVPVAA